MNKIYDDIKCRLAVHSVIRWICTANDERRTVSMGKIDLVRLLECATAKISSNAKNINEIVSKHLNVGEAPHTEYRRHTNMRTRVYDRSEMSSIDVYFEIVEPTSHQNVPANATYRYVIL